MLELCFDDKIMQSCAFDIIIRRSQLYQPSGENHIIKMLRKTMKQEQINGLGSEQLYDILDKKMANLEIDPFFYFKQAKLYDERRTFLRENMNVNVIFNEDLKKDFSYKSEEDLGFMATQKFGFHRPSRPLLAGSSFLCTLPECRMNR